MLSLSSISIGLEFLSANHKNITFLLKYLIHDHMTYLEQMYTRLLNFVRVIIDNITKY